MIDCQSFGQAIKHSDPFRFEKCAFTKTLSQSLVFENKPESEDINFDMQKISNKIKDTRSSLQIEDNYNILPNRRNIRFDPNRNFTGRNKELVDLYLENIGDLATKL